jgi:hypothetical protein
MFTKPTAKAAATAEAAAVYATVDDLIRMVTRAANQQLSSGSGSSSSQVQNVVQFAQLYNVPLTAELALL